MLFERVRTLSQDKQRVTFRKGCDPIESNICRLMEIEAICSVNEKVDIESRDSECRQCLYMPGKLWEQGANAVTAG